jgi:hypothetical protein
LRQTAMQPDRIGAVVSRSGRPDLVADDDWAPVAAPTLLIVGGPRPRRRRTERNRLSQACPEPSLKSPGAPAAGFAHTCASAARAGRRGGGRQAAFGRQSRHPDVRWPSPALFFKSLNPREGTSASNCT